jgi:hypothetical protein
VDWRICKGKRVCVSACGTASVFDLLFSLSYDLIYPSPNEAVPRDNGAAGSGAAESDCDSI